MVCELILFVNKSALLLSIKFVRKRSTVHIDKYTIYYLFEVVAALISVYIFCSASF